MNVLSVMRLLSPLIGDVNYELVFLPNIVGEGLRIKPSMIPNAGLGLYTTRPRINNEKLDNYNEGTIRESKAQIDQRYGDNLAQYVWCSSDRNCRDAKSTQSNWSRYANACLQNNQCTGIIKNNGNLRTLRPLQAGEEILINYGPEYML
ncbi:MAG: SET domain-containing protein-lysine N-methyltransferase [Sphingobacteriaceae bacterium]|nr:MAG: SET domain-containing protein-lysine N-methyltransferase [Sphingobacteriaceae bacterium]